MKKLLLLYCIIIPAALVKGQSVDRNFNGIAMAEAYDVHGKPFTEVNKTEINGSAVLNENWGTGFVKFKNGIVVRDMLLQFSLYENELYFKRDNIVYRFDGEIVEFKFTYEEDNIARTVFFRKGYPDYKINNANSFYQVITDGYKVQLIKFMYKVTADELSYGGPVRKKYDQKEQLLFYDVQQSKLIPFKKDKSFFTNNFPGYTDIINRYIQEKNTRSYTETELAELVKLFNQ